MMTCKGDIRMEKSIFISKKIRRFTAIGAGILLLLLFTGCANEGSDWDKTLSRNTVDAYSAFLKKYPDSPHASEASQKLTDLQWENTRNLNTTEAYQSYVQQNPNSPYLAEAEEKLINSRWEAACKTDTVESYKQFLEDHLQSEHTDEAILKLTGKQPVTMDVLNAFKAAVNLKMYFAYAKFAEDFKDCPLSYKAREMMARFGTQVYTEETTLSKNDLLETYNWNGEEILWKWDNKAAGLEMDNGNVIFLSDQTVNPKYGIPFTFGISGKVFGNICIGNIQITGPCRFDENGIVLEKGSKISYPL